MVAVAVAVAVAVCVAVLVAVGVAIGVGVLVGGKVGTAVRVGVGGVTPTMLTKALESRSRSACCELRNAAKSAAGTAADVSASALED